MNTFYIEEEIINDEKVKILLNQFQKTEIIKIKKYTDIFNRTKQDFRFQKNNIKYILAKKRENFVLQVPNCKTLSSDYNFYFSTTLNCLYDCEYCYLQGMYNSAYIVIFINIEDFLEEIKKVRKNIDQKKTITFFSSYNNDGLAMENITNFAEFFIKNLESISNVNMEIRTKSSNIKNIEKINPAKNTFLTWTISTENTTKNHEKRTSSLIERLNSIEKLLNKKWRVHIRFEPLVFNENWKKDAEKLFLKIKNIQNIKDIEKISIGHLRFTKDTFKKINKVLPNSKILAEDFFIKNGTYSYKEEIQKEMMEFYKQKSISIWGIEKLFSTI